MCYMTKGKPKRWCKRPSSSSANGPEATTLAEARCGAGCSRWPARPPSTSPGVPRPGRSCPSKTSSCRLQYDSVDQALHKLPSIYGNVMRLVRDSFTHSEIAERLGIPIGTVKSRMAKAADTLRAEPASLRGGDDAV
jgi:Sigma-70, region 4